MDTNQNGLLTMDELVDRWQPPGPTPAARDKWMRRRMGEWGLKPLAGTRGGNARFRPADVDRAEARGSRAAGNLLV